MTFFVLKRNDTVTDTKLELTTQLVTDGKWHNVTVTGTGTRFKLAFDGMTSQSKDFGFNFEFGTLDLVEMTIGGSINTGTTQLNGRS